MKYVLKSTILKNEEELKFIKELQKHFVFETASGNVIKTTKECRVHNANYLDIISTKRPMLLKLDSYMVVLVED